MGRPTLLCACLTALMAGCGGDGEGGSGGGRAVTVPAGQPVRVAGDDYSFSPSTVVVSRPGPTTITLDNKGSLAHNLKVFRGESEIGGTPTFQGGVTRSGTVRLARGSYRMVCTVGDHAEQGMVGELEVR